MLGFPVELVRRYIVTVLGLGARTSGLVRGYEVLTSGYLEGRLSPMDRSGPARLKTVESALQKSPGACVPGGDLRGLIFRGGADTSPDFNCYLLPLSMV